jgi:hypothetical protein
MRLRLARSTVFLALAALFWPMSLPASAHPIVDVANPQPMDRVIAGSLAMEGVAYDHDSKQGAGVDSVSVRICGQGGTSLGDAVLGLPSMWGVEKGDPRFANAGWKATVLLKGFGDTRELCVTARSSVNGSQTLVRIPVTIGWTPPPPPVPAAVPEAALPAPVEVVPVPSPTPAVVASAPSPDPGTNPEEVGPD